MKKKLKIIQVAPLWFAIPPKKYGGTERIVSFLVEELIKLGHQVTLFAPGSSKTKARLFSLLEKGAISLGAKWQDYWWNIWNHSVAFEIAKKEKFDIIHCHWGIMGAYFQNFVKIPTVHTLHNIPSKSHLRWRVFNYYKNILNLVFISESERKNAKVKGKRNWVIYNGIDISPFKFNQKPENYFTWVARVCKAKGILNAIEVAKKTGIKLLMAGQVQPQHKSFFETKIKPNLSSKIKFLGELNQKELSELYQKAKALLYPIEWEEPFGLVMAEAMACGTPVIGYDRGSVRELIKDKETGFVVKDLKSLESAIKKIDQISRKACRERVEKYFTKEVMAKNYEKLYYQLLKNN